VSIAQENAPATDINLPCYLTDEEQRDYPRPNGNRNRHRRYMANRVRASPTNFSLEKNGSGTQNYCPQNNGFAQNDRRGNVENHHHQNHSDSPASEPLIKHTYDELKVKLTNTKIYDNYGDLEKVYRDVLIKRLFYLLLPGARNEDICMSKGIYILLKDVVDWVRKDCGLRIREQDIKATFALYIRGRLEIANDVFFACLQQRQEDGEDRRNNLRQSEVGNSLWKHGLSQNARSTHERPEPVVM